MALSCVDLAVACGATVIGVTASLVTMLAEDALRTADEAAIAAAETTR